MQINSIILQSTNKVSPRTFNVKPWVTIAIAEEDQKPSTQLWRDEPSADFQCQERVRRIRFLRKWAKDKAGLEAIADTLERCKRRERCCSGACPECSQLLQRWLVRRAKTFIRDKIEENKADLVAITIIPAKPIIRLSELPAFSVRNLQRRLKHAFDRAGINVALGGIDISFNEDSNGKYRPFWCVHAYVVTSTANRDRLRRTLKQFFHRDHRVPRPVKISDFENNPRRRSYVLKAKFIRRVGVDTIKTVGNEQRHCRNTSRDKLRARERIQLFQFLHKIGLAERCVFRHAKPVIKGANVRIRKSSDL
jgi:hypothetical protein